tara:strand:+ start:101 stop:301 length:201 start_codon:yes stop_codon:yes gene_type:complete
MTPREAAQIEAEVTYIRFLHWCKIGTYVIIGTLLLLASCNFGVDDKKKYPNYNGEVYSPMNIGEKK